MNHITRLSAFAAAALFIVACGGEKTATSTDSTKPGTPAASSGPVTPAPGGKVIEVTMTTDEKGNYFSPAEITANKGDVVRFTLKVGVHNVHFLPDSNAKVSGYPSAASEFLQLPGQTYDLLVDFAPGRYYFQCDPHAALGMMGHITVQ
jgi:plastocyanin